MAMPSLNKFFSSLREHLRNPLFANAYALMTDQVATSALGFLYWVLAARLYDAGVVGENSAILSTVFFIVSFSELSMRSAMARFVPRTGKKTTHLILFAFGINIILAFIGSLLLFSVGGKFELTANLVKDIKIWPGWLILFAVFWVLFGVLDGVLTGMRKARWVVLKNFIHSASKIIILFVLVKSAYGVVISWFLPAPFIVVGITASVLIRFMPEHLKMDTAQTKEVHRRELFTSITGDHIGTIVAEACVSALPLLILQFLGKEQTAYYYQAWLLYNALSTFAVNMASSFAVEASADMGNILKLSRLLLRQMVRLFTPMAVVAFLAAPLLLALFGQEYVENGKVLLRLLIISILPFMINAWFLSYSRVLNRVWAIILIQSVQFVVTLGVTYLLLPKIGIAGIGAAWLLAQCSNTVIVVIWMAPKIFSAQHPKAAI